jgi:hypothetical protein
MVGHQHIGVDSYLVKLGAGKDCIHVVRIIGSLKETCLTIIAALYNV